MHAHPYYPLGLEVQDYRENESTLLTIVGTFSIGLTLSLCVILGLAIYRRPSITYGDRLTILWFALCKRQIRLSSLGPIFANVNTAGILHCFFEGYFVTHHDRMGPAQDIFGQLWKEYAKSDSRYLVSDSFVVSIETITVVS